MRYEKLVESFHKMVQLFKGKSSKIIREGFLELEEVYWGDSFWADDYFTETPAKCDVKVTLDYVRNYEAANNNC